MSTAPAKPIRHHCDCGRGFTTRSGMLNHGRACPIERARSAAFIHALETGTDPHLAAAVAVHNAKRAAYYATPHPARGADRA